MVRVALLATVLALGYMGQAILVPENAENAQPKSEIDIIKIQFEVFEEIKQKLDQSSEIVSEIVNEIEKKDEESFNWFYSFIQSEKDYLKKFSKIPENEITQNFQYTLIDKAQNIHNALTNFGKEKERDLMELLVKETFKLMTYELIANMVGFGSAIKFYNIINNLSQKNGEFANLKMESFDEMNTKMMENFEKSIYTINDSMDSILKHILKIIENVQQKVQNLMFQTNKEISEQKNLGNQKWSSLLDGIQTKTNDLIEEFKVKNKEAIKNIKAVFKQIFEKLKEGTDSWMNKNKKNALKSEIEIPQMCFSYFLPDSILKMTGDIIKDAMSDTGKIDETSYATNKMDGAEKGIRDFEKMIERALRDHIEIVDEAIDKSKKIGGNVMSVIKTVVDRAINTTKNLIKVLKYSFKGVATDTIDEVKKTIGVATNETKKIVAGAMNDIMGIFREKMVIMNRFKVFTNEVVKITVNETIDEFKELVGITMHDVKEMFGEAIEGNQRLFERAADEMKRIVK